jgi:hypothetical protein
VDGDAHGLAVDASAIYWLAAGTILRTDKDSISTQSLVSQIPNLALVGVDVDGGFLVWTSGIERRLHGAALSAFADVDLGVSLADYDGQYGMAEAVTAQGLVYWTDGNSGQGSFFALSVKSPGAPQRERMVPAPSSGFMSAFGDSLFWTNGTALWKAHAPDASSPAQMVGGTVIAYRNSTVYTSTGWLDVVMAAPGGGESPPRQLVTFDSENALERWSRSVCAQPGKFGASALPVVAADDESVFDVVWSQCMGTGGEAMGIVRGRGADNSMLVSYGPSEATRVVDIAVDNACVYWVTTNGVPATAGQKNHTSTLHAIAR